MSTHPLSLANSARVPRSLSAQLARATAPETDQTPVVDQVLLVTTANALRTLQGIVATQAETIRKLHQRVSYLEGAHQP